ncbi:hypothetical protein [Sinorhizobium medicae]|uniref:hypothetical protein n=1 Tax=Sinorhizobium medicae TaxID=110321 RepID=UPI00129496E3|nr:hypothetical protein [Sinorhizobium medicae]MBO1940208.1 hypothetical protein [Sinorhizobium medicae]MDX0530781.1 hypothetical protein [Sinorhizobium medicae]MDX0943449.1 hypothetical protein [Sinorhizobium medicae]MDX0979361.1 hypothetical protein [Sinorhizobium medicae]MQV48322.1 hypothetical protein [Sinorhizobium medicae]
MRKKEKPPLIQAIMTPRGLRAHTQDDAEKLASIPEGSIFEIVPVTTRSDRQLRTYWKALGLVVKVTQKWSSAENLHRDIKMTLGYREQAVNMRTGEITLVPDSIALDKMEHAEFCEFMNQAMALIADTVGFDPLAFLAEERAA